MIYKRKIHVFGFTDIQKGFSQNRGWKNKGNILEFHWWALSLLDSNESDRLYFANAVQYKKKYNYILGPPKSFTPQALDKTIYTSFTKIKVSFKQVHT